MENTHSRTPAEEKELSDTESVQTRMSTKWQDALKQVWFYFVRFWRWSAQAIGSVILFFIILGLVVSLISGSMGSNYAANEQRLFGSGLDKVAIISVEGVIGEAGSSVVGGGVGVNSEVLREELAQAADDPLVKAVVLEINSPGGSAVVSDQIFQLIVDFKEESGKKVVASLGDTAASGGYYIAAASDRIVANPSTLTGSIGVLMQFFNAQGLLSNLGVESQTIKSGDFKDIGSFTRETSESERRILQEIVMSAHEQFVQRVIEGRSMDESTVESLADGRIFTGSQAKENGLVDELGNLDTAVDVASSLANISDPTVVKYDRSGWFDGLLGVKQNLISLLLGSSFSQVNNNAGLQYRWMPY